ncbi:diacylglycerol/polyprenol kinase family protein [Phaeocystidibacter luteus]|uniref:Phosphatidate cytidylyltransferase n=1 Tax=Phaeocystidibacter luteus TaxID=911197 RepID=A0A6N6RHS1_9FLAO|nr:phosphatidate cytidylyltransferase [Phaeocystidibacter luteus]KAB2809884.1 phosphatidate cytidylyltransferase [Phaeocystidibacter luteus]
MSAVQISDTSLLAEMSGAFLALFGISEYLYRRLSVRPEITRKISHIGTGILVLLFPLVLKSHWDVLILCSSFLVLLLLSFKYEFLKGINNVDRKTFGSVLYPVGVYITFCVYEELQFLSAFYIPVLILAISDPLAALVGRKTGWNPYRIFRDGKSVGGTIAFLISAFAIAALSFSLEGMWKELDSPLILCAAIAVTTTVAEAASAYGSDNLSIPVTGALLIFMMT